MVSGVEEIADAAEEPIEVELCAMLADGKPFAVKVVQPDPLVYYSLGRSIPIPSGKTLDPNTWSNDERREYHTWRRDLCAASVVAIREAYKYREDESLEWDGIEWSSRWVDARFVKSEPVDVPDGPKQVSISDFDKKDNTKRVYQALMVDAEYGGDFSVVVGCPFRGGRPGVNGVDGEGVREVAARDSVAEERPAGV